MQETACHGRVDDLTGECLTGWAFDPRRGDGPASVFLFVDQKPVANVLCTLERPELSGSGLRASNAGFRFALPPEFMDGAPHEVSVRFDRGEHLLFSDASGRTAASATFSMAGRRRLLSYVDGLNGGALRGWAVMQGADGVRRGGLDVLVVCNGVEVGRVKTDRYRADVGKAVGGDPHCGFIFMPPPRFRDGRAYTFDFREAESGEGLDGSPHTFQYPAQLPDARLARMHEVVSGLSVQLYELGRELQELMIRSVFTLADYDGWALRYRGDLRLRRERAGWPHDRPTPLVSILCPIYRPRLRDFIAAVESVLAQSYSEWELILIDDDSGSAELTGAIEAFCARDARVRTLPQRRHSGISATTNAGIRAAAGAYVAFFDHDDLLHGVAVEMLVEAAVVSGARIVYSDEDKVDDYGRYSEPNFKSDWNYRLLLGQNYVCHFLMVERSALQAVGPLRKAYDGAQDHDLLLRLAEMVGADEIVHVPEVLYHWRKTPGSTATAQAAKPYAADAGSRAVRDHLKRLGHDAAVRSVPGTTLYDVRWRSTEEPVVTVVIPFRDQAALTSRCLESVVARTEYGNFDVLLVDNWSVSAEAKSFAAAATVDARVRVLRVEEAFNYARLNNLACGTSSAEFFVFMNNDVFVEQADWLRLLIDEALADPAVGAVGAKLVYPDRTVQHGGVILGVAGVGDHAGRGRAEADAFYMGRGVCAQDLSAVTAALMLCRAAAFRSVGGFDERELGVAYNDVDLCLKLRRAGYRVLYCPAVIAEHHESISRGDDLGPVHLGRFVAEERVMLARWAAEIARDPFYNPNFSRDGGIFEELSCTWIDDASSNG